MIHNYDEVQNQVNTLEVRLKYQREIHTVEYYDGIRLTEESVPSGKYAYQTRHSDTDMAQPVTIAPLGKKIIVNFCGTIVSDKPLNVRGDEDRLTFVSWIA